MIREYTTEEYLTGIADELLGRLGYDEGDPHLLKTPQRFAKMLMDTAMVVEEPDFEFTTFPNPSETESEMIVVEPIHFYTFCAHHMLPFFGTAHIAYVPHKHVVGLSKIPRLVKWASRGLWTQEELTSRIARELSNQLDPVGVGVFLRARHLCMEMRGVREYGVGTTTTEMRGCFLDPTKQARQEFLSLVRGNG